MNENKTPRAAALLPIAVFLVLYLGLGIVLEYVLKVKMGFYQIPIVVAFLVAILVACLQNRSISFDEKLALMGQGIGDKNIVTMILIFLAAGIFVGVTGRSSAEAVAYFLLSIAPAKLAVAVLFVVLLVGIVAGAAITLAIGQVTALQLMGNMGSGVSGMFETILVTLLVSSLCGLIRAYGGFDALLAAIHKMFRGKRGGQVGIGLLVGLMDISTANNTVAIVMAGPIAKEIATEYGISPKRSASLLDTFSCVFQGIIPYGAQMLVAISACATLGFTVSAFEIIPLLFYPMLLCLSSLLFILFDRK